MQSTRRLGIVLNTGSGAGKSSNARESLATQFETAGFDVTMVELDERLDLPGTIERLAGEGVAVIVAAGGDGTVNAVAGAIVGRDLTLGVLPMGTLNHFARDLGLPLDLEEAARVIIAGHTTTVDAAEVNGRIFLNNSSVGLYPRIVKLRERHDARGIWKWAVATWATARVVRQALPLRVHLSVDGADVTRTTPLIFIGNNEYRMAGRDAASRASLQDGQLALYLVKTTGQWKLLRLAYRILAGSAFESGELAMVTTAQAEIDLPNDTRRTHLDVALDGEVMTLPLPLRYRTLPQALRVCVPS